MSSNPINTHQPSSSGGMSNSLFCCSLPDSYYSIDSEPTKVLLRFYGDQLSSCDISSQIEIFNLLSSKDLGPKLYGQFEDGRLEEFLPANSLTSEELMNDEISSVIAKKMASVHSLDAPIERKKTWIMDKLNEWVESIDGNSKLTGLDKPVRHSTVDIVRQLSVIDFKEEIKFLAGVFEKTRSPNVFSHNDLHQGNILLAECSKRRSSIAERIVFIDFEYCSYNYRAYDIANHFCEWCFEYDTPDYPHFTFFEKRFPSIDRQRDFIRHYLNQSKKLSAPINNLRVIGNGGNGTTTGTDSAINGHKFNGNCSEVTSDSEVEALLEEVQPFFMVSNLLWTIWCIKNARSSTINFGYWVSASWAL